MSTLSQEFRELALELVEEFGKTTYEIRRTSYLPSNPTTPTLPGQIFEATYQCKAAVAEFKVTEIDGTDVMRGDKMAVVAWTTELPTDIMPQDLFVDTDSGFIWHILPDFEIYTVNGVIVAYLLHLRK